MHIAHIGAVPRIPLVTPLFTGDQVTEQALLADEGRGYSVRVINFIYIRPRSGKTTQLEG